jgi:DNA-binding HxlR family transcriptional regulator
MANTTRASRNKIVNPYQSIINQCSIARAGQLLGDSWTLLIIRELFWRSTRYDQIAERTGMASNILADRLRKLVDSGIACKTVVQGDARRFDYALTKKGAELFPLLMAVLAWGDKWAPGNEGPLVRLHHHACGKTTKAGLSCSACGEALSPAALSTSFAPAYRHLVPDAMKGKHTFKSAA